MASLRHLFIVACVAVGITAVTAATPNAGLSVTYGPITQTFENPCNGNSVTYAVNPAEVGESTLPSVQTQSQPWVMWDFDTTKYYTLILQDIQGGFTHWFSANIIAPSISAASDELLPYFPPLNPTTTPHNYTFILYEQPGFVNISQALMAKVTTNPLFARINFPYEQFVSTNHLTKIGSLVNFGTVDQWTAYMWHSVLDSTFLTSAEKQALQGYYSQACANHFDEDPLAVESPPMSTTGANLNIMYGPDHITFTNPCDNITHVQGAGLCLAGAGSGCQGSQTASTPWITWNANSTKRYTIILYDVTGNFMHTMFSNIIGSSVSFASNEIFPYFPPGNPTTTAHAYTWMLYEQENWITVSPAVLNNIAKNPLTSRIGFDYSSIVSGMKLLDTIVNEGHVTPWTAYFYSNFLVSPVVPVALRPDFQPYYKAACANYPSST